MPGQQLCTRQQGPPSYSPMTGIWPITGGGWCMNIALAVSTGELGPALLNVKHSKHGTHVGHAWTSGP